MIRNKARVIDQLNRILECELSGVVRYTHYSMMIFGYNRIPIVSWFRTEATESLTHAQQGLMKLVAGKNVAFEEYARGLIEQEEAHIDEIDKMLHKPGDVHMSKEAQDLD